MALYDIKEISIMLDVVESTLRIYLGHYSFDKFRKGRKFNVNDDFLNTLLEYVTNKRNRKYIYKIERFINGRINARKGICNFCTNTQNNYFTG